MIRNPLNPFAELNRIIVIRMGYIPPDHILFTTAVSSAETTASWENYWHLFNDIHHTFSIFPDNAFSINKAAGKNNGEKLIFWTLNIYIR